MERTPDHDASPEMSTLSATPVMHADRAETSDELSDQELEAVVGGLARTYVELPPTPPGSRRAA